MQWPSPAAVLCLFVWLAAGCAGQPHAQNPITPLATTPFTAPAPERRLLAFISDLHMGLGRDPATREWHKTEDFRWHGALAGFLREISQRGGGKTDLIILGDFLELWQPPDS